MNKKVTYLSLNVSDLALRELVLVERHFVLSQILQETELRGQQEQQGTTLAANTTGSTTYAVNVLARVIWGIVLNDPIHCGDVQASCCYIRAQQNSSFSIAELEEGFCSFLLLLFAL
jgi:hypothetical protein